MLLLKPKRHELYARAGSGAM